MPNLTSSSEVIDKKLKAQLVELKLPYEHDHIFAQLQPAPTEKQKEQKLLSHTTRKLENYQRSIENLKLYAPCVVASDKTKKKIIDPTLFVDDCHALPLYAYSLNKDRDKFDF